MLVTLVPVPSSFLLFPFPAQGDFLFHREELEAQKS